MANFVCPKCQFENSPKAKFCSECGTSLVFKCPICSSESPLDAKFCSGCGKAISMIQKDIETAQKIGGESNRELSYTYDTRNNSNYHDSTHHVREVLAIDEYVLLKESRVFFYKGDVLDVVGDLYLTNRRILILGSDIDQVFERNYSYPLKDIKQVDKKTDKVLFFTKHYLQIITDGKLRKFCVPERALENWINTITKYMHDK